MSVELKPVEENPLDLILVTNVRGNGIPFRVDVPFTSTQDTQFKWPLYKRSSAEYNGEWKDGYPNGRGILIDGGIIIYDGEWKDGYPNGKGIFKFRTRVYDGDWFNGEENGLGTTTWPDGRIFKGNFVNGRIPLVLPNGDPNMVKMIYPQPDGRTKVYEGQLHKDFSYDEYKERKYDTVDEKSKFEKAKSLFSGFSGLLSRRPTKATAAEEEMTSVGPDDDGLPETMEIETKKPSTAAAEDKFGVGGSNSRMKRRQSKRRQKSKRRRQSKRRQKSKRRRQSKRD
jgi:hypothetical protein